LENPGLWAGQSKLALLGNNTQWSVGVPEYWSVDLEEKEEMV